MPEKPGASDGAGSEQNVGRSGEHAAAQFLVQNGLRILHANWRCRLGELDLVATDGECLIFVEVKTRRSRVMGTAAEAVDRRKQQRLQRLAAAYLQRFGGWDRPCRFDVVAVTPPGPAGGEYRFEWIRAAFA